MSDKSSEETKKQPASTQQNHNNEDLCWNGWIVVLIAIFALAIVVAIINNSLLYMLFVSIVFVFLDVSRYCFTFSERDKCSIQTYRPDMRIWSLGVVFGLGIGMVEVLKSLVEGLNKFLSKTSPKHDILETLKTLFTQSDLSPNTVWVILGTEVVLLIALGLVLAFFASLTRDGD